MSMTVVNAKIYVARVVAGASTGAGTDMAGEAILRTYQDWQAKQFWRFLLKDTSVGFSKSGLATKSSATVTPTTAGNFDGVNVGVAVTYSGVAGTLAAATVASINYNTDGTTASIVLSTTMGGGAYITETGTYTFAGDIPIIAGTRSYNLPSDWSAPMGARLIGNDKRPLTWKDIRAWDRTILDQTVQGTPDEYTVYNPYSDLTQNFGETRLRLDVIPSSANTLNLRYYRSFNTTGTNIDIPDNYLYMFLDYARARMLEAKKAQDDPAGFMASQQQGKEDAAEDDAQPTDDDDADQCLKSQYEQWRTHRNIVNGPFDNY